jgi:hypothetical protein
VTQDVFRVAQAKLPALLHFPRFRRAKPPRSQPTTKDDHDHEEDDENDNEHEWETTLKRTRFLLATGN